MVMIQLRIGYKQPYSWTFDYENETIEKSQENASIINQFSTTFTGTSQ